MHSVDEYRWLDTSEAQRHWQNLWLNSISSNDAVLKQLRKLLSQEQASLLMEQFELASIAKKKVAHPQLWFWTRQLLEQASDEQTAFETAADFQPGDKIIDVCCGAGADAIAMCKVRLDVQAVDRCPVACYLTERNAINHRLNIKVTEQDAEHLAIAPDEYVHIDPDRRAEGSRVTTLSRLSPSWDAIRKILHRCSGMSLKLAPGLRVDWNASTDIINRLPESIRFISKEGTVRQQRWYWGIGRWPAESITCSMFLNRPALLKAQSFYPSMPKPAETTNVDFQRGWFHETFLTKRYATTQDNHCLISEHLDTYIGDYDPSLRAAECGELFAARYGLQLLGSSSGYFISKQPLVHPMVRWFRVVDQLPLDRKKIKVYSKHAAARSWELKSRGIDIDLDAIRKLLATDKAAQLSKAILFTHFDGRHQAIVCEEV